MRRSAVGAEALEEAAGRSVEVEEADRLVGREVETVDAVRRGRDEGARSGDARLLSDAELDLAFEHVEAVGVVGVCVRVDALEARAKGHVDRSQLREVAEDPVRTGLVLESLGFGGVGEDRLVGVAPAVGRRIVLVEPGLAAPAEHVPEAHRRRVDVEEDGGRLARVPERVDDVGRRRGEDPGCRAHRLLLRAERELDLALEHVERIGVVVMDVRVRALLARLVAEQRDDQRLELGEDANRPLGPVSGRLALAGR